MSNDRSADWPYPEPRRRLGYLLKHAQLRMHELIDAALAPHGVTGRELAVLLAVAGGEPASQQQAAHRLGVDRTSMVALLDALEDKQLVTRHPHVDDRRKNVVELTGVGRDTLRSAVEASDAAERRFLAPLDESTAEMFRDALYAVVTMPRSPDTELIRIHRHGQSGRDV